MSRMLWVMNLVNITEILSAVPRKGERHTRPFVAVSVPKAVLSIKKTGNYVAIIDDLHLHLNTSALTVPATPICS